LVIGQGLALTAVGIALGVAGALVVSRGLMTLLYGITRLDPPTYGAVAFLMLAVSVLACGLPARRAVSIDPVATLRAE
jgi:putative ABC transport system permease protein